MSLYEAAVASIKMSNITFSFDHMWHAVKIKIFHGFDGKILTDRFQESISEVFISRVEAQVTSHPNVIVNYN